MNSPKPFAAKPWNLSIETPLASILPTLRDLGAESSEMDRPRLNDPPDKPERLSAFNGTAGKTAKPKISPQENPKPVTATFPNRTPRLSPPTAGRLRISSHAIAPRWGGRFLSIPSRSKR